MAATLTPDLDVPESPGPEITPLPLVNPITVSLALVVLFLVGVLAAVSVTPAGAGETQGADDAPVVVDRAPGR